VSTSTFLYDELPDMKGISLYGDCLVNIKTPTTLAQNVNRASWLGPLRGIWRMRRVRRRLLRRPDSTRFEIARLTLECLVVGSSTAPGRTDRRFLWPDPILEVMLRAAVRGADRLCSTLLEVCPRVYARMEGSLRDSDDHDPYAECAGTKSGGCVSSQPQLSVTPGKSGEECQR